MSKGPATFRKADIRRGVEAIESAGLKVARIEVDKSGKVIFFPADSNAGETAAEDIKL